MRAPNRARRFARPGPVWGDYPQRVGDGPRRDPWPLRRLPIDRIARAALAALDASAPAHAASANADASTLVAAAAPIAAAASALMRDGLSERSVVLALTLAARLMIRHVGLRPGLAQLRCAALLLDGRLAEMDTGEGKTCAAGLAAAVAGLAGAAVHVLTANDYLAERDQRLLHPLFDALGLRSASVREADDAAARRIAYRSRIVYTTARCIAFDYLRDQQCADADTSLLNGLCLAIVDEADSVLIDEASMPLVLAASHDDPQLRGRVWRALTLAQRLTLATDFIVSPNRQPSVRLTDSGRERLAAWSNHFGEAWRHPRYREELIEQALQALHRLRRDVDYLVRDGQVVIIDAISGRPAAERRWSRDLHALVALKEQVPIPPSSDTCARITYPRLFARYHHLCGLSGTLTECRAELRRQYGLRVQRVPRATPQRRLTRPMRVFANRSAQFDAAIQRARRLSLSGRAVLMLSDSVQDTRDLADACAQHGLMVVALSASDEAREADVIAQAGQPGRVTVATQMAGRGTDITLADAARAVGGLHIINLQHNRSARVDRQIAGRAGRRGDPGSVEHWIRLDDSPLASPRIPRLLRPLAALAGWRIVGERGQSLAGRLLISAWQGRCERDDRHQRAQLAAHDQAWSRALSFTRIKV